MGFATLKSTQKDHIQIHMYIDGVWFSWSVPVLDSENPTSTKEASEAIGYKLRRVRGESEITNPWKNRVPSLNLHEHVVTMGDSTINSFLLWYPRFQSRKMPCHGLSRSGTLLPSNVAILCGKLSYCHGLSRVGTFCHKMKLPIYGAPDSP